MTLYLHMYIHVALTIIKHIYIMHSSTTSTTRLYTGIGGLYSSITSPTRLYTDIGGL